MKTTSSIKFLAIFAIFAFFLQMSLFGQINTTIATNADLSTAQSYSEWLKTGYYQTPYTPTPLHVSYGNIAVYSILPANNVYGTGGLLKIKGINGESTTLNNTQCAPFVTQLLKLTYNLSNAFFQSWSNSNSPNSAQYFDAINAGTSFTKIPKVAHIQRGDIIAIKYIQSDGSGNSGHTMIASTLPKLVAQTNPIVNNTLQYELQILDSTSTPHGQDDSRINTSGQGLGRGTIRIYATTSGDVAGYTWSKTGGTFYGPNQRPLVIGRLNLP